MLPADDTVNQQASRLSTDPISRLAHKRQVWMELQRPRELIKPNDVDFIWDRDASFLWQAQRPDRHAIVRDKEPVRLSVLIKNTIGSFVAAAFHAIGVNN
jgi:hypothetical protein